MKNTVQIYGLPRSGTNFLEWSVVNNFHDITYKNQVEKKEIKEIPRSMVAVKHQLPSFKFSDKIIIIYKKWNQFSASYKKWAGKSFNKKTYDSYLELARSLEPSRTIIFEHSWLVDNYEQGMGMIASKFDLKIKNKITKPLRRMNKGGALSSQTGEIYIKK